MHSGQQKKRYIILVLTTRISKILGLKEFNRFVFLYTLQNEIANDAPLTVAKVEV